MAWIFSLSIECGSSSAAWAMAHHFEGFAAILDDGSSYLCPAGILELDGDWWAIVCPEGVTRIGIQNEEERVLLTEVARKMYDHLRSAPPFRFALAGVEVDGFRSIRELDSDDFRFDGLVLNEAICSALGCSDSLEPFAPGYRWQPLVSVR